MTATHALFKSIKLTLQYSASVCKLHLHCFLYENHPYLSDFQKSIPKRLIQAAQFMQNHTQNATSFLSNKLFAHQTVNCHHTVKTSGSRVTQSKKTGVVASFFDVFLTEIHLNKPKRKDPLITCNALATTHQCIFVISATDFQARW